MEQRHRNLLKNNHVFLVKEMDLKNAEVFWAHLIQMDVITPDMRESIEVRVRPHNI